MTIPGRVSIEPRAIRTVVEATAAETFEASPKAVRARVHGRPGGLDVEIATPLGGSEPLLAAAATARDAISARCSTITGATFGHVRIRVTGIVEHDRGRVR